MYRVELKVGKPWHTDKSEMPFLMYRVELKDSKPCCSRALTSVPNVPCGVESQAPAAYDPLPFTLFLMYRVELKAPCKSSHFNALQMLFLMYRVELRISNKIKKAVHFMPF